MYYSLKLNSKWSTFILTTVKMKSFYAQVKAMALSYFREDPNAITSLDFFRLNLVPRRTLDVDIGKRLVGIILKKEKLLIFS